MLNLSKYVIYKEVKDDWYYLFNCITSDIIYIKKEQLDNMLNGKIESNIEKILLDNNICVTKEKDDENIYSKLTRKARKYNSGVSLLRVLLTDKCNIKCRYCKVVPNVCNKQENPVPIDKFEKALKVLINSNSEEQKIVHITGGEPLLFEEKVLEIIKMIKKFDTEDKIMTVIGTNSLLLSEKFLKEILKYNKNIKLIVSLDGNKKANDVYRNKYDGSGTYDDIVKKIKMIKKYNVEFGISMVIGTHNIDELQKNVDEIINQFNPSSLGTNFMKHPTLDDDGFEGLVSPEIYAKKLYEVFKNIRDTGIYMELISRKITSFANKEFRIFDCGATAGSTINIDSRGNIGPCKSMLILENEDGIEKEEIKQQLKQKWQKRSPITYPDCVTCPAVSICGNGCAYEALINNKAINSKDNRHCTYSKIFIDCMIMDLFEMLEISINDDIIIPTAEERKKIVGNMKPVPKTLKWSIGHATTSIDLKEE